MNPIYKSALNREVPLAQPGEFAPVEIGPLSVWPPVVLAPMAGVTDKPFRRLCRHFGAGMTTSEMTTADTSLWQTPKSRHRLDLDLDAEPVAVQIAGSEPEQLALAARACVDRGAQIIDINMGCPAKKVCRKLAGSALMKDEVLYNNLTNASKELEALLRDIKLHPKRFVHFSLFGKKDKGYQEFDVE